MFSVSLGISEYLDETALIPKNTTLIVDRVPGDPCLPIFTELQEYYLKPDISTVRYIII